MSAKPSSLMQIVTLEQSISLIKAMLDSSNDGILVVSNEKKIIDYNKKFATMWRIPPKILESHDENKALCHVYDQLLEPEEFLANVNDLYQHLDVVSIDILKFKDGRIFERYTHPYKLNEKVIGRIWLFRDVTRRAKLEEELNHQLTHDVLTGLPNRLLLFDRMRQAVSICHRDKTYFALFVLDLDRFKIINDSLTHMVGDELLRIVGRRLQSAMREGDTLARIGGDEFVIVATDLQDDKQAVKIARNLHDVLNHPFKVADREISVTASIGISLFPRDGETVDILLRNADASLYRAKEHGANRFEFYTASMNSQSLAQLDKEMQLRRAIVEKQFFLEYQPQINILTSKIVGVEALVRWQHPEYGVIEPLDFIPLAEEAGLITQIGEWVLNTACEQAKLWQDLGIAPFRIAVNISESQIKNHSLVEVVRGVLKKTGLDPRYLELEISENVILGSQDIIKIIQMLKDLGVEITLDDFGTGSSSLSYLKRIPLNRLKIDYAFMRHVPDDRNDSEIVRAIVAMGRAFGLDIVAEGVEKNEQIEFLKNEKCVEVQGFYFSRPLCKESFENFVRNNNW